MEKNKVVVKIRNKEYIIKSADTQEYIISVANELDTRINEIVSENTKLNSEKVAILASLNLCDEYMKLKEENESLKQQVQDGKQMCLPDWNESDELERAKAQIKLLEARLSDDASSQKEYDELKSKLTAAEADKKSAAENYEKQIKELKEKVDTAENDKKSAEDKLKKQIEELKKQIADKEKEWLEMIDNM